jgi:hypothetical protein
MASEGTCKLFISAVDYFRNMNGTVLIDRQISQALTLKAQVGSLGGAIDAAYVECLDLGSEGTVRNPYATHSTNWSS